MHPAPDNDLPLFARTYPDRPGAMATDTSEAAAEYIDEHCGRLQRMVLDYITAQGPAGATDEEIQRGLELRQNTARPRRRELELKGFVIDSGRRRMLASGRVGIVWVLTPREMA